MRSWLAAPHQGDFLRADLHRTAIEGRRVQRDKLTENDTVVVTHNDFAAAFESLLHVLPDTKTIVIVNGVSPNEKFWEGGLWRELAQFSNRVELNHRSVVRSYSEKYGKPSSSHRHFLAFDER